MVSSLLLAISSLPFLSAAIPYEDVRSLIPRASTPNKTAPNQPPAVPPNNNDCNFQFFTQSIDHFGLHNGTFNQKYNLVTDFFKPGGPIFLYQGEEQTYLDCVDTSIAYSWAQQTHGIAVVLEHRYFGESAPFGANDPTTQPREFDYLTLDNVLADGVSFLDYLKKNVTGAQDSKAIVLSGSYGGFLSTVYRQNHPEAIYGAIASAPPVETITNNSQSDNYWNWNIWLNNVYQDKSVEAASKIKNAIETLEQRFNSGNLTSLQSELGLCYMPTKDDFPLVNSWLQNIFSDAAELNYPIARPGRAPVALSLDRIVNITKTQNDPIQILNETLWMWYGPGSGVDFSCIDYKDPSAPYASVPLIQQAIFSYLTCKYFPMDGSVDVPNGTIFYATNAAALGTSECDKLYNISTPSADQLRTKYKYTPEDLRNSTRIIWSLGQYDPVSGVAPNQPGINAPALSADRNMSRILYTTNMAHREDLFAPDPSDRDTVVQARAIELESVKGWLGWYDV